MYQAILIPVDSVLIVDGRYRARCSGDGERGCCEEDEDGNGEEGEEASVHCYLCNW